MFSILNYSRFLVFSFSVILVATVIFFAPSTVSNVNFANATCEGECGGGEGGDSGGPTIKRVGVRIGARVLGANINREDTSQIDHLMNLLGMLEKMIEENPDFDKRTLATINQMIVNIAGQIIELR